MSHSHEVKRVAFLGIGNMGAPMARHLARAGHRVIIFNRNIKRAEKFLQDHRNEPFIQMCSLSESPADACKNVDYVCVCVGRDEDVEEVLFGSRKQIPTNEHSLKNSAFHALSPGTIIVDHSTISAKFTKFASEKLEEKKCFFLDAPISGGVSGAEKGTLVAMVGSSSQDLFEAVNHDILRHFSNARRMGDVGTGQMTKMMNQILLSPIMGALAEGLCFAKHAGVDVEQAINLVKGGAAGSWQLEHRSSSMLSENTRHTPATMIPNGFSVDLMLKDLLICLDQAKEMSLRLPLIEHMVTTLQGLQQAGHGEKSVEMLFESVDNLSERQAKNDNARGTAIKQTENY